MIPQGDNDLTAYFHEPLKTNEPEQQNKTLWFPTPENPGKPTDHTPIQTRTIKEVFYLTGKENINPKEST